MACKKGGWFGESKRHALAAKGIKTGRKKMPTKRMIEEREFLKDSPVKARKALREHLEGLTDEEVEDLWDDYSQAVISLGKLRQKMPEEVRQYMERMTAGDVMDVYIETSYEGMQRRQRRR